MKPGTVALIGAGPGNPELLTLRGLRLLERADVVVHDRLGTEALLDVRRPGCRADRRGQDARAARHVAGGDLGALVALARSGRRVVRLKGGDPFVFGRGGEEALALVEAGIPFQVVPGVSSAVAVPAAAGIPVTHRGLARTVTIASGHDDPGAPAARERWRGTCARARHPRPADGDVEPGSDRARADRRRTSRRRACGGDSMGHHRARTPCHRHARHDRGRVLRRRLWATPRSS